MLLCRLSLQYSYKHLIFSTSHSLHSIIKQNCDCMRETTIQIIERDSFNEYLTEILKERKSVTMLNVSTNTLIVTDDIYVIMHSLACLCLAVTRTIHRSVVYYTHYGSFFGLLILYVKLKVAYIHRFTLFQIMHVCITHYDNHVFQTT